MHLKNKYWASTISLVLLPALGEGQTHTVSMLWYMQKLLEHVLPHVIGSPKYGLNYSTHTHTPYLHRGSKLSPEVTSKHE